MIMFGKSNKTPRTDDSYTDAELDDIQTDVNRWNTRATVRLNRAKSGAWGMSEVDKEVAAKDAKDAAVALAYVDNVRRSRRRG